MSVQSLHPLAPQNSPPRGSTPGSLAPIWKEPPPLSDVAQERLSRKQRLAAGFRIFAKFGFDFGVPGHITVRDPEWPDHFWVNPLGMYFGHIRVSDLLLVSHTGEVVIGDRPVNQAAFAIHSEIHKARPDVNAAAHSHSIYGKAWSTLGRLLDPITQDSCAFYENHVLFEDFSGVVFDSSEGEKIATTLGQNQAAILQNHGFLTVGKSVDAAVWRYISFENAAQAQLLAEAAGKPKLISPEIARHTASQAGGDGWFGFQPFWDQITREQPDLFE